MSNKISTEVFDEMRIEKIKHHLESLTEKGKARYFEIYVDNLKVVEKTNDIELFDEYKIYVDDNTKLMKLLLYSSCETSPRNDKFLFSFKNHEERTTLGEVEIQNKISTAINAEKERLKIEQLENKVEELEEELEEANSYIEKLESGFEDLKTQKVDDSKQMKYGMIASIAIEQIIKRNPKILNNIPLIGSLAGLLEDNSSVTIETRKESKEENTNYQFKEVNKFETEIVKLFTDNFNEAELETILKIINRFAEEPSSIQTIHDLLFSNSNN